MYTCTLLSHTHREKGRERKTRNEGESVDEGKKSKQRKKSLHKCSIGYISGPPHLYPSMILLPTQVIIIKWFVYFLAF
jgi:hypothetical protein